MQPRATGHLCYYPVGRAGEQPMAQEIQAYCVRCKAQRPMVEVEYLSTRNGRPAARGKCAKCGTVTMKFLKSLPPPAPMLEPLAEDKAEDPAAGDGH
jgi:hypothetical protein